MHLTDFSEYLGLEILFRIGFSIAKYIFFAGIGYFIFYVWKRKDWFKHKIQEKFPKDKHLRHEIYWSVVSRIIIGFVAIIMVEYLSYTKIYYDVSSYGVAYLLFSIVSLIVIHDTYFYWMHRVAHAPKLYRIIHKVHHHSTNPTPLASFSFHPTEAILEILPFPILLFLVPIHPIALVSVLVFQLTFNVYGHSGFEMAPKKWVHHPILKYINTSTHHNLHHKEFHHNYGLYFNYWDRWMGTMDPNYEDRFLAIKDKAERLQKEEDQQTKPSIQTA
ncbi:MAG: sterol desaturase family protein [Aureispira sp.]|nr:sterol desaturase family protein [Aureispira sp.]